MSRPWSSNSSLGSSSGVWTGGSLSPVRSTGRYLTERQIFLVDANQAGKGQLEISVNQGRVPNNVQMQGAGKCLVTFIPQEAGTYVIDVTFNDEVVRG